MSEKIFFYKICSLKVYSNLKEQFDTKVGPRYNEVSRYQKKCYSGVFVIVKILL